jgi:hypothetical protein
MTTTQVANGTTTPTRRTIASDSKDVHISGEAMEVDAFTFFQATSAQMDKARAALMTELRTTEARVIEIKRLLGIEEAKIATASPNFTGSATIPNSTPSRGRSNRRANVRTAQVAPVTTKKTGAVKRGRPRGQKTGAGLAGHIRTVLANAEAPMSAFDVKESLRAGGWLPKKEILVNRALNQMSKSANPLKVTGHKGAYLYASAR